MRVIGHLTNEAGARAFSDYLFVQGIQNQIETESDGAWAVWVHMDDQIAQAKEMLASFIDNPSASRFQVAARQVAQLREQEAEAQTNYRKKVRDRKSLFPSLAGYGFGPLTLVLIALSIVVFVRSDFANNLDAIRALMFSEYLAPGHPWHSPFDLVEITHGEVWRLVTPIFVHGGVLHILFNMLWMRDLGSMIEARLGTLQLALLVVGIAAPSNMIQYVISGPVFFGMSGVVYGLLGYVWIRGRFDPGAGLFLNQSTVVFMLVWLVVCFTGYVGHIANAIHLSGLAIGMLWAYAASQLRRRS